MYFECHFLLLGELGGSEGDDGMLAKILSMSLEILNIAFVFLGCRERLECSQIFFAFRFWDSSFVNTVCILLRQACGSYIF